MAVKIDKSKRPVGKTYVVYDFADAPTWRWRTERDYFLSRSELQDNNGLKQFLGF